jgi:hypothetical protein
MTWWSYVDSNQTSCMPWEMRKFNCRQMPARDGPCHATRTGHAQNDGQMTVKTILKQRWITPIPVARNRQSGKVPASPASRANACTDGDNPGGTQCGAPRAEDAECLRLLSRINTLRTSRRISSSALSGRAADLWVHDVGAIGVEEPSIPHRRPIRKQAFSTTQSMQSSEPVSRLPYRSEKSSLTRRPSGSAAPHVSRTAPKRPLLPGEVPDGG